jgi:undecaprenyldiphospho-muramoylpentapeptide beta-N-acetylglucosaminyltransferase
MTSTYALVTGGGTGGHVIPAIAIGRALVELGHPAEEIHFVGARRGIEAELVPAAGFTITLLPGRGIARHLTVDNIGALFGLARAVARAIALVRRRKPQVVISVGGFASVPCALAAWLWRVPLIVAEQNAVPGLANRLVARVAVASAVSFPGTTLPRAVLTGNPVRPELLSVDRSEPARAAARTELGLGVDDRVIVVAGGSLGARTINAAVLALASAWADRKGFAIRHIVGARDFERISAAAPPATPSGLVYQLVRFEDHMERCYAAADVAVHRAGASTVAELATAGVPSILVPLPGAPGDHQSVNAKRMVEAGGAIVVPDGELDATRLAAELDGLFDEPLRLQAMARAARTLARPGAALAVAELAQGAARG